MCEKCVKNEKFGRGCPGRGGGFGNSDTLGQGEGGGLKIRDFGGRPNFHKPPPVRKCPKFQNHPPPHLPDVLCRRPLTSERR